jgi:hypothetical protein
MAEAAAGRKRRTEDCGKELCGDRLQVKKRLTAITRQVRELSKKERYRKNYELLVGIPGIGLLVGMFLLTQLGDLGRFKSLDELCSTWA